MKKCKCFWHEGTPVAGQQLDYAFEAIGDRTPTQSGGSGKGCIGAAKSFSRIIMSIYFLCFASGLLILFAGGCGGSSKADVEFMRQVQQTKAHYSASEIRKSALKLLGRQKGDEAIPGEIKSLPIFQEEGKTFISVIPMENAKGLIFSDGGGFSGQGIIVCLSEDAITNIVIHGTVLRWEQGVYFWADWRVTHGVSQSELVLRRE